MKKYLIAMADHHAGHKLALMNPKVVLYDESETGQRLPFTPKLTASQEYLWEQYLENLKDALLFCNGGDVLLLHNGDLCHGKKHPEQLVSTREADQIEIACANLEPWFAYPNVKHVRIVAGTSAHNFGEATAEILSGQILAAKHPDQDVSTLYHGLLTYNGLDIDYAHHGPHPGSRTWLDGNTARYYLRDRMLKQIIMKHKPAGLYLRAHYHQYVDEPLTIGEYYSRIVILPSYSMLGDYATARCQSPDTVTNGLLVFAVEDGEVVDWGSFTSTIDVRTKETI